MPIVLQTAGKKAAIQNVTNKLYIYSGFRIVLAKKCHLRQGQMWRLNEYKIDSNYGNYKFS